VVLLDLGIAAVFDPDLSRLTRTGESLGSPGYMAPEQATSGLAGPHSDLYALGCILHEVLTGHPVFSAPTPYALFAKHAGEPPTPVRVLRPDVPEALEALILELLAKQPESRPATARTVYQRLAVLLPRSAPGSQHPDGPFDPLRPFHTPMAPPPGPGGLSTAFVAQAAPAPRDVDLASALAEADELIGAGKHAPAVHILGAALGSAQRQHDPHGPVVRSLRKQHARILMLDGQVGPARTEFLRLAQTAAADHGPVSAEALGYRFLAAQCSEQAGEISAALAEYQAILPAYAAQANRDPGQALAVRDRIGKLLLATGRPRSLAGSPRPAPGPGAHARPAPSRHARAAVATRAAQRRHPTVVAPGRGTGDSERQAFTAARSAALRRTQNSLPSGSASTAQPEPSGFR